MLLSTSTEFVNELLKFLAYTAGSAYAIFDKYPDTTKETRDNLEMWFNELHFGDEMISIISICNTSKDVYHLIKSITIPIQNIFGLLDVHWERFPDGRLYVGVYNVE